MNTSSEFEHFSKQFQVRFKKLSAWVERNCPNSTKKTVSNKYHGKLHPRLESFTRYYDYYLGKKYVLKNYYKECGAAKQTVQIIDNYEYRKAIEIFFLEIIKNKIDEICYIDFKRWLDKSYMMNNDKKHLK